MLVPDGASYPHCVEHNTTEVIESYILYTAYRI
jgi:hypothetical protein